MFCKKCGKQLPNGSAFCAFCGEKQMDATPPIPKTASKTQPANMSATKKQHTLLLILGAIALSAVVVTVAIILLGKRPMENAALSLTQKEASLNQNAISAGGYGTLTGATVGLKTDGTVVTVGAYEHGYGQLDVSSWRDIVAISAGRSHIVGLKADGTVVAVGEDELGCGQLDVSGWRDIIAISAGEYCTVGIKANGTVVAVGADWGGQTDVSDWENIVAVITKGGTVGLKEDGTVVAVGSNNFDRLMIS